MVKNGGSVVKNLPANSGDVGSVLGWGRFSGGENGNWLQYSCLENPTDRGARQATVHRVTKSQARLSDWAHIHTLACRPGISNGNIVPMRYNLVMFPFLPPALFVSIFSLPHTWMELEHLAFSWKDTRLWYLGTVLLVSRSAGIIWGALCIALFALPY